MRLYFLTSLAFGLCCIIIVQSCLFKLIGNNDGKKLHGKQSGETRYTRKIYPDTVTPNIKCVCGQLNGPSIRNWEVIVYTRESDFHTFNPSCMGVIIAHNLVLTSHKCITEKGKQMRPYEAWQPSPRHHETSINSFDYIRIGITEQESTEPVNITYNPEFGVYAAAKDVASADDIAVIVVKDEFFELVDWRDDNGADIKIHAFLPVCLPVKDEKTDLSKDVLHRYGFLYGYGGIFPHLYSAQHERRIATELVILDGKECDEEQNFGDFSTSGSLCIRTVSPLPSFGGVPLFTNGNDGKALARPLSSETVFLAGLGTVAEKRPPGKHISYAYFGNVFKHLDYIEKVAKEHGSMWCTTPPYVPVKEDRLALEEWPWESGNDKILRSETLDCACGFKNSDKGRIAGGKDAIPHEFGWMVKLFSSFFEDDEKVLKGRFLCGASIINDRVILTAAHCVVEHEDKQHPNGIPFELVKATIVAVGAHAFDDVKEVKVKQIIVHPGYVSSLKNGAFSFDMALLILKEPINFAKKATTLKDVTDNDIRPICLPKVDQKIELKNGTELTAMGWGILDPWTDNVPGEHAKFPDVLQKLQVPVRDLRDCTETVKGVVPDTVFCIANYTKKFGVTPGDSGGPLVYRKPNGQYFQVGAVSYGIDIEPDASEWLDFIVDVQQFVPFIEYYSKLNGAKWCKK